jgi:hypothetical protein
MRTAEDDRDLQSMAGARRLDGVSVSAETIHVIHEKNIRENWRGAVQCRRALLPLGRSIYM